MTPPIAILGAGPSGLALARLLEIAKIDYIVFERDESEVWAIGRGGTLDVHTGSGQVTLKEAGLVDRFKALARYDATNTVADAKGTVHASFGEEGEQDRPEIDRKDLRALLLSSIPVDKVRWGSRVQDVRRDINGTMSVRLVDGHTESGFKLVVGADGAWSKARALITPARPQYSGLHYLTTTIKVGSSPHSTAAALAGQGNYIACGDRKQLAVQKLGGGSYYLAVGLYLPENWSSDNATFIEDPSLLRQWLLREHLSAWPKLHTDLIEHSESDWRAWPLYAMPVESLSWQSVSGVTLMGDAAHVSTPFVGEGVNCALYDSLELYQQIVHHGLEKLNIAVAEYEKSMFPRAIDLIKRSKMSGELLFAEDAPKGLIDAFFSGAGAEG